MIGGRKPAKYKCAYKIRDKATGLFSKGGGWPKWGKSGKVWNRLGDLKSHLTHYLSQHKTIPDTWEVCEYPVLEPIVLPITDFIKDKP